MNTAPSNARPKPIAAPLDVDCSSPVPRVNERAAATRARSASSISTGRITPGGFAGDAFTASLIGGHLTRSRAANAFDAEGKPTKGAEAFAKKLGLDVSALRVVDTPKGKYVGGTRKEAGKTSKELLPKQLSELIGEIPFRKSMRWGTSDVAF